MIPRRFFWLFDGLALMAAFLAAHALAPVLQHYLSAGAPLATLAHALGIPPIEVANNFRAVGESFWVLLVMVPATILLMEEFGGYRAPLEQSRTGIVACSILSPLMGFGLITLVLIGVRSPRWSRLFIFSFTALSAVGLATYRLALRWYRLRRLAAGYHRKNLLLIGPPNALARLMAYVDTAEASREYHILGYLAAGEPAAAVPMVPVGAPALSAADTRAAAAAVAAGPSGPPYSATVADSPPSGLVALGIAEQLAELLIRQPIHEVIVVESGGEAEWVGKVIETCDYFRVTVRIVPAVLVAGRVHDLRIHFRRGPLQLPQIVLHTSELDSDAVFLKRIIDIVFSSVMLALLSPLFAVIALAIKVSTPHLPVFYPWRVIGYKGQPFTGYKFTTMVADADEQKARLMHLNEMSGPVFKIRDDPRMTPLGRFLRKYSLNELPQLWSVLKGDMSLVGPRPAAPRELERYELWHKRKLSVRPGITCLWQVRGRNQISNFDDWVRMDLEYIDRWTLWLDFKILWRTVWAVLSGSGS